jgi:hypothetical protein
MIEEKRKPHRSCTETDNHELNLPARLHMSLRNNFSKTQNALFHPSPYHAKGNQCSRRLAAGYVLSYLVRFVQLSVTIPDNESICVE